MPTPNPAGSKADAGEQARELTTPFVPLSKMLLSAGALGTGLAAYGFFSEAATLQFMGLPQLTAEVSELIESGGRALIDSFATLNGWRMSILAGVVLALLGLASLRGHASIGRVLRWPVALATAQLLTAGLLLFVAVALIKASSLARPHEAARFEADAQEVERRYQAHEDYDPVVLGQLLERLTYDVWPSWWPWHCGVRTSDLLCRVPNPGAVGAGGFRETEEDPESLIGYPTRLTHAARVAARETFGWLFLWVLAGIPLVMALWAWGRWLDQPELSLKRQRDLARAPDPGQWKHRRSLRRRGHSLQLRRRLWAGLLGASRTATPFVLAVLVLFTMTLLPGAYGVLARPTIGHQQVIVVLKSPDELYKDESGSQRECRALPPLQPAAEAAQAPPAVPAVAPPERGFRWECPAAALEQLEAEIRDYRKAWQELVATRPSQEQRHKDALEAYRERTDALLGTVARLGCAEAYRRARLLAPDTGEAARRPDIADWFWLRWAALLDQYAPVRFGYLLNFPRGESSGRITLFQPIRHDLRTHRLEARFEEIPRACIASLSLMRDERRRHIDDAVAEVRAQPLSDRLGDLVRYPGRHALQQTLSIYEQAFLSEQRQGALVTTLGVLAQGVEDGHSAKRAAIDALLKTLRTAGEVDTGERGARKQGRGARARAAAAAASALHLTGSPYAAIGLAHALEQERWLRDYIASGQAGTVITTAGLLANDLARALRERPPLAPECQDYESPDDGRGRCTHAMVRALRTLTAFLAERVEDGSAREQRMAACTALGAIGTTAALNIVGDLVMQELDRPRIDWTPIATCMVHMPTWLHPAERSALERLAQGRCPEAAAACQEVPPRLRRVALMELHESGLYDAADFMFERLLESDPELAMTAAQMLDEVAPEPLAGRLLDCARDPAQPRQRCAIALRLLDDDYSGDDGLAARLAEWALAETDSGLRRQACLALRTLQQRGGIAAAESLGGAALCRGAGEVASSSKPLVELAVLLGSEAGSSQTQTSPGPTEPEALAALEAALQAGDLDAFGAQLPALLLGSAAGSETLRRIVVDGARRHDFRTLAFEALVTVDVERHADLAAALVVGEGEALDLVATASQYLENRPFAEVAPQLLDCAENNASPVARRLRCVLALPLLEEDAQGDADFIRRLLALGQGANATPDWQRAFGLAQAEYLARGAVFQADADLALLTPIVAETRAVVRWLEHLQRFSAHLQGEAKELQGPAGAKMREILEVFESSARERLNLILELEKSDD